MSGYLRDFEAKNKLNFVIDIYTVNYSIIDFLILRPKKMGCGRRIALLSFEVMNLPEKAIKKGI